jgi:ankyrin repeat protein
VDAARGGNTALLLAAEYGHAEVLERLIAAGSDLGTNAAFG